MSETVKLIVTGNDTTLLKVREPVCQLLQSLGFEIIEKGEPKDNRSHSSRVMYLQAQPVKERIDPTQPHYIPLEGGS